MNRNWLANTTPPAPSELPSRSALIRATLAVVALAVAIVLTTVLPAEYGIDPTGLGQLTGLTYMGEFKVEADREFAAIAEAVAAQKADSAAAAELSAPAR